MSESPVIFGPGGQPARKPFDALCPSCGAGKEKRVASGGFGARYPVCGACGHEFTDEVWRGETSDRR